MTDFIKDTIVLSVIFYACSVLFSKMRARREARVEAARKTRQGNTKSWGYVAPKKERKPLLIVRFVRAWREEEQRMREAEEIEGEDERSDEDLTIHTNGETYIIPDEEDEDDEFEAEQVAFHEKELSRLYKVRAGLENKRSKMRFVYGVDDETKSEKERDEAWEKMTHTKAWRGLQFDLEFVTNEIDAITKYLKRED